MPRASVDSLLHEGEDAEKFFDPPYLITDGNNAPARHPTLERIWLQGTQFRRMMEESQSFQIGITFRIHTNNTVQLPPGMAKSQIVKSKSLNNGKVLNLKAFLYGKSLTEMKDLVGNVCDLYFPGIKTVVLDSMLAPMMTWNATVGSKRFKLNDYWGYQAFINKMGDGRFSKAAIHIRLTKASIKRFQEALADGGVFDP